MTTIDVQVDASADDAAEAVTTTVVTLTGVNINMTTTVNTRGGWHFTVTGPASGDTVDVGYIQLYAQAGDTYNFNLDCQAADNPGTFTTTNGDLTGRALTGSAVLWNATVTGGTFNNSPSLVTPLQAVIDRAGWASGNGLVVLAVAAAAGNQRIRTYDNSTAQAAILHMEYTAGGGGLAIPIVMHHRKLLENA